ncbi:MAG TPA: hypothetical protein VKY31_06910 [Terriglobia bacterium]|nr:hypothetical protein [Terriglobia bacterium]
MNLVHVHLWLNHLPILGTLIALALFLVALIWDHDDFKQVSLALFVMIALFTIPAYMSGNAAQNIVKDDPAYSMEAIQAHQGSALMAFIFIELTGAASLLGLWRFSRAEKNPWMERPAKWHLAVVLVLSLATSGLMAIAGNTGGEIRHPEIASGPGPTSAIGNMGFQLADKVQHFVIDSSMWVWPILEDLHFIGLILIIGAFGALNVRILGMMKSLPVAPLHRFIPWGIAGFFINIVTGMLFFMGMPGFYTPNVVFQIKMFTIMLAGLNLLLFQCTSAFRSLEHLGPGEDAPLYAKIVAASSLVLWIAAIVLGRYIPFGEVS